MATRDVFHPTRHPPPAVRSRDSFAADGSHDITPSPLTLPFRHAAFLKDATPHIVSAVRQERRADGRSHESSGSLPRAGPVP